MQRPKTGEYSPYYENYISLVEGNEPIKIMERQLIETPKLFSTIPANRGNYAYDTRKWTIKEILGHLIDTERVFAYRAMCISRGEQQSLPGFEQDDYVKAANFGKRKLADLIEEYGKAREATIAMFKSFDAEAIGRRGIANKKDITVNALFFIIPGHEQHHLNILKEKYIKL